jgi:hypothetical protein
LAARLPAAFPAAIPLAPAEACRVVWPAPAEPLLAAFEVLLAVFDTPCVALVAPLLARLALRCTGCEDCDIA